MADSKISHENRQLAKSGGSKLPMRGRSGVRTQAVRRKTAQIIIITSILAISGCGFDYIQAPYQDRTRADFEEYKSRQQQKESDRFLIEQHDRLSRDTF